MASDFQAGYQSNMDLASLRDKFNIPYLIVAGGWALLFMVAVVAYWPGLSGPFILDDFGSVMLLGDRGGVVDWDTFKTFVFTGAAGPTGRPISVLSFLLDARNWPADPWPFKRTNLVIHLLNGALIGVISFQVLRITRYASRDAKWIALLSTAVWLLHPFMVSTTLYIVQRMAQISTLFVLAGLAAYIHGRNRCAKSPLRSYLIMSAAVGCGTLLAVLSKENGILLPLLVGVLELTIFASQGTGVPRVNRLWGTAFIVMPTIVIALYLGKQFLLDSFFEIVPPRDFSLYERLLTQPRVIVDYLYQLLIPKLYTTGVFQDHFLKSTGILQPFSTMMAIVFHAAVIAIAFAYRRRWPIVAFATLFFYGGHLLESTVLNLELYFEHRNYLPAAFLFLPLAVLIRTKLNPQLFVIVFLLIALTLAGFTRYSANVWTSYPSIVEASARKAPASARAQAEYSVMLFNVGRHEEALNVLDRAIAIDANATFTPLLSVNRLVSLCKMKQLDLAEFDREADVLSAIPYDPRLIKAYTVLVDAVIAGDCPDIDVSRLNGLFIRMLQVPRNSDRSTLEYSHVMYLIGHTSAFAGEREKSIAAFEESLAAQPGASHAMQMASVLATNGYFTDALRFSDIALRQLEDAKSTPFNVVPVGEADVRAFRAIVREEIKAQQGAGTSDPVP